MRVINFPHISDRNPSRTTITSGGVFNTYINGVNKISTTGFAFNSADTYNAIQRLGYNIVSDDRWINGNMDDLRFYNIAISALQVQELY